MTDTGLVRTLERDTIKLTLDRPGALNALSSDMLDALGEALEDACGAPGVARIVLAASSPRAFCAGADVRAAREAILRGDPDSAIAYFETEYRLQALIASAPKPVFALVDGLCLGAGMGLAVNATYAIAADGARFAMPETLIGFFPDAGASHFLNRLPGCLGLYLGLTGSQISAAEAHHFGLISHRVPNGDALGSVHDALVATGLDALAPADGPASTRLTALRPAIDRCFSGETLPDILARLDREGTEWSRDVRATLGARSPTALSSTIALFARARGRDLAACIELETGLMARFMVHADFSEGVRAALVDKDKAPRFEPEAQCLLD